MGPMARMLVTLALLGLAAPLLFAQTNTDPPPAWLFPIDAPGAAVADQNEVMHLARSKITFTTAQLTDLFFAPDWYPEAHDVLPQIVAYGRAPDVYACGYCHSPSGQGRPENASLAGLPVAYIEQQVADFKSAARRRLWTAPYRPSDLMTHLALFVTPDEVASAAQYFSKQRLLPRVAVMERTHVPRARVVGLVYASIDRGGDEELGDRLLEFSPDPERHEKRDEAMRYIAYVPVGSLRRGRALAAGSGAAGRNASTRCATCHGHELRGVGLVPGLAGHSPSYLLRQLIAFKTGARAGPSGVPMMAVVAGLQLRDMIAVAAYAAFLPTAAPPN
jgi:cytochrome c553